MPGKNELKLPLILSYFVILFLIVSSIGGLIWGEKGLYENDKLTLPQLLGQDGISLLLAVPLLIISILLVRKEKTIGLLLWMGGLFYVTYGYFFYVIGVKFNALFLVYVFMVSFALYALLNLLIKIDAEKIKKSFALKIPRRSIAGFMVGISLLFYALWFSMIITTLLGSEPVDKVARQVWVIDLVILLPLLVYAGIQLWRDKPWGYALTGMLLIKIATLGITLLVNTWLVLRWDPKADTSFVLPFSLVTAGSLISLFFYLKDLKKQK